MNGAGIFIIAQSREKGYASLASEPGITTDELELEGTRFG